MSRIAQRRVHPAVLLLLTCAFCLAEVEQPVVGQEIDAAELPGHSAPYTPPPERVRIEADPLLRRFAFGDSAEGDRSSEASEMENGEEEDEEYEERLKKLEEAWSKFQEKQERASARPTMEWSGRIHLDQWAFPTSTRGIDFFENPDTGEDPENRFLFRRIRPSVRGEISEIIDYRLDLEFGNLNDPTFKDAYVGFRHLPVFQTVRVGHQKRPLGFDHWNSSNVTVFMERPVIVEAFNQDSRRLGVASYGGTEDFEVSWQTGFFLLEDIQNDGDYTGDSEQFSFNSRLAASPWYDESSGGRGYLHLAVANMLANPDGNAGPDESNNNEARFRSRPELRTRSRWVDTGAISNANWFNTTGLEAALNIGPFSLVSEYQQSYVDRHGDPSLFFSGAYVYAAYFLTGEHVPYDRETSQFDRVTPFENFFLVNTCNSGVASGLGAWQVIVRYSYANLSDEDVRGGRESNVTLGLNWWWTAHSRLQFNYVYGDIEDRDPVAGYTGGSFTGFGTRIHIDF